MDVPQKTTLLHGKIIAPGRLLPVNFDNFFCPYAHQYRYITSNIFYPITGALEKQMKLQNYK
jgi:hypothetical protein